MTTIELMKEAPRLAEWRFEFVWPMALRLYFAIKPFVLERFAVCRADASPRGSVPGAHSRASSRKPLVRPWVFPC